MVHYKITIDGIEFPFTSLEYERDFSLEAQPFRIDLPVVFSELGSWDGDSFDGDSFDITRVRAGAPIRIFRDNELVFQSKIYEIQKTESEGIARNVSIGFGLKRKMSFLPVQNVTENAEPAVQFYEQYKNFEQSVNGSLVLCLPMLEGAGTVTYDYSGQSNDGTLNGTYSWTSGKYNNVVYFDGDGGHVLVPHDDCLSFTSEDFSVAFWFYADLEDVTEYLICKGLWQTDGWDMHWSAVERIYFRTYQVGANQDTYTNVLQKETWYHIVLVREGATATFYVNGVDATASHGTHIDPVVSTRNLKIGMRDDGIGFFHGKIDEVRIYNRVLTIEEILDLYEHGIVNLYGTSLQMEYGSEDESKMNRTRALEDLCFVTGWEIYVTPTGIWDFRSQCGTDRSGTMTFARGELTRKYVSPYSILQQQKTKKINVIGANFGANLCFGTAVTGDYQLGDLEKDINRKSLISSATCGSAATALLADFQNDVLTAEIEVVDTFEGHAYDVFDTVCLKDNLLNIDEDMRIYHIKKRFAAGLGEDTTLRLTNIQHLLTSAVFLLKSGEAYLSDSYRGAEDYARTNQFRPIVLEVSASRALDTIYQNTTGRPLLVVASIICERQAIDDGAYVDFGLKSSSPPNIGIASVGHLDTGPIDESVFTIVSVVPLNYYYRISSQTTGTGVVSLLDWNEAIL